MTPQIWVLDGDTLRPVDRFACRVAMVLWRKGMLYTGATEYTRTVLKLLRAGV